MLKDEVVKSSVENDKAEEKKAEAELRETGENFQTLLNLMPDLVIIVDENGNILAVNDKVDKIGFKREELLGKNFPKTKILAEKSKAITMENLAKRMTRNRMASYEVEVLVKDGRKLTAEINAAKIEYEGNPADLFLFRDISERKHAEEELRKSEEKYRSLVELALDAIVTLNLKGVITSINAATVRLSGYNKDEIVGKHFSKMGFLRARDIPKYLKIFSFIIMGKIAPPVRVAYIRNDSTTGWVEAHVSLLEADGQKIGIQAILRDITERKLAEEELTRERDLLQSLMDNIPDSIYFKDAACRLIMINRAAAKCTPGINDPAEIIGKTDFTHPQELAAQYYADDQAIIRSGKPVIEKQEPSFNGRWVSTTKVPIKDKSGRVTGIVGITRDITERKRMEDELRRYSEHLGELVEERTKELKEAQERLLKAERLAAIGETAAMVGHDLRNPLQVIVNTLYSAKKALNTASSERSKFADEQGLEALLRRVEEQVGYMNKIVSDLQEYARPLRPELVETSLRQLIDETFSTITIPENVKLSIAIEESFPNLMVDPALMKRVLTNLVTNALQAMPKGGQLTIRAFVSKTEEIIFISVVDTGMGVSEENIAKLFQPLFTTKPKGTGFGLPVCKRLVEAHDGTIIVESQVNKGSKFTVKIPLRRR